MRDVLPFILCGGAGTRLWPLSREAFPKQFHKITGDESLFQQTCRRLQGAPFGQVSVLTNQMHRFLVAEQLEEIALIPRELALEPVGRNTGPAACIAALIAAQDDPSSLALITPADHFIPDAEAFTRAIEFGMSAAEDGALVVFGIEPDCPHTGYGYIETDKGNALDLKVKRFVEKPSQEEAEKFIDSGAFYWNTGVFLFKAEALLSLFEAYAPDILDACHRSFEQRKKDLGFLRLSPAYADAPAISLDHAIAEKADNMRCVPLDTMWSDVGSWATLWKLLEKDNAENVVLGEGEILLEKTRNSLVYSDHAFVALLGLNNVVMVATDDAVLVASKDYAESVKDIVGHLKGNGGGHAFEHTRVYRPWGWYQRLSRGDGYQVKSSW